VLGYAACVVTSNHPEASRPDAERACS